MHHFVKIRDEKFFVTRNLFCDLETFVDRADVLTYTQPILSALGPNTQVGI